MSRIGRMPVTIKDNVTVTVDGSTVTVQGQKGTTYYQIPLGINVQVDEGKIKVAPKGSGENIDALFGLVRAQLANMIQGVSEGFEKKLELSGVGYRASVSGNDLVLSVGFSHPVKVSAGEGITFKVVENVISISGIDAEKVGNKAAQIRGIRPPEPYKGKGISYQGERIRRKAGKAAKAVGGK